jgi:apolipoprotein D and lipocalin family protein
MKWVLCRALGAAAVLAGLAACSSPQPDLPLPTVAAVDLGRYLGTWCEIALVPNPFQKQCVADTQARYRLQGDTIEVCNRRRQRDGKMSEVRGVAKPVVVVPMPSCGTAFFDRFTATTGCWRCPRTATGCW